MRKVILSLAASLDGYIEGPNREIDWMEFNEETGKALGAFLDEIDTIFYGRVSYEAWGYYMPPETASDFEKEFYYRTGKMKKYVFSGSTGNFKGDPAVINSDLSNAIEDIRQQTGKHIWLYGGAGLISSLANVNLIDEIRIAVMPIILGDGNPLFKDIQHRIKLKLLSIDSGISGVVGLNYEVVKP
jgi:dihydrofolate reductase